MPYNFGNVLKKCRSNANMTVKQVSDLLTQKGFKASESTIYSWENGNSQPTPGALLTMCNAYGVDDILNTFGYDNSQKDNSFHADASERDMIEKYRRLDPHGKEMIELALEKEFSRVQLLESRLDLIRERRLEALLLTDTEDFDVVTIAAHHDDIDWSDAELAEIEDFQQYVRNKRK